MIIDFASEWRTNSGKIIFQGQMVDTVHQQVIDFLERWSDDSDIIQVHTSGSTGTPKEIDIPKRWMQASAERTLQQLEIPWSGKALLCISPLHIGGMMMIVRSMIHGLKLSVVQPSSCPRLEESFDFTAMVPLQVSRLLQGHEEIESYGTLIIGGAPISAILVAQLRERKAPVYATFGMTETVSNIALRRLNSPTSDSYFHCHPGVNVSETRDGHLRVRISYMDDLDLITQDLVQIIDDSTFLWKGRADNVINSGGIKLIPEQLETKLSDVLPKEFFLTAVNDELLGQKVILVIESSSFQKTWPALIEARLSAYERPRAIRLCEKFARTQTGKVMKVESLESSYLVWSKEDGVLGSGLD